MPHVVLVRLCLRCQFQSLSSAWNRAMPQAEDYLRVKEAAAFLGVAPNTVRSWGDKGKIPEYRHPANNYRLYKKTDLQEFIEQIERSTRRRSGAK